MSLHSCVAENAIHREGYKPFGRTIGDALNALACRSAEDAFMRDELESLRTSRPQRNTEVGGKCESCGKEAFLHTILLDDVEFLVCRKCG